MYPSNSYNTLARPHTLDSLPNADCSLTTIARPSSNSTSLSRPWHHHIAINIARTAHTHTHDPSSHLANPRHSFLSRWCAKRARRKKPILLCYSGYEQANTTDGVPCRDSPETLVVSVSSWWKKKKTFFYFFTVDTGSYITTRLIVHMHATIWRLPLQW